MLGVSVTDNDDQAVAVRAPMRLAPPAELIRGCPNRAVALVGSTLDLQAALAALTPADRVVVDCGVDAEMAAFDLISWRTGTWSGETR